MRLAEFLRTTATPQGKFAARIGVQQGTVSRYVSGEQIPSTLIMLRIRDLTEGAVGLDDWRPEKLRRRSALLPGI
jgi:DNA-binding transcriptional regulator YdaS (Cro superfamily)